MNRTAATAVGTGVVAGALLAAALVSHLATKPAPYDGDPRRGFGHLIDGGTEPPEWLDLTEGAGAESMPAMIRVIDSACGGPYPQPGIDPVRARYGLDASRWDYPTLHYVGPVQHPTQTGRWALPSDSCARKAITDYCTAHPGNGCAKVRALPAWSSGLDSTWLDGRTAAPKGGPPDALDGGAL